MSIVPDVNRFDLRQTLLEPGQVEQDPDAIWEAVERAVSDGIDRMCRDGTPVTYIKSLAVVNEMGTLVAWSAETGAPVYNAIHWTDARMKSGGNGGGRTAAAVEWLRSRSEAAKCTAEHLRFGTLDAWLLWKLTAGQTYGTDVTNASYTGLLDLSTLDWDRDALSRRGLHEGRSWPAIRTSAVAVVLVGRLLGVTVHVSTVRFSAAFYGHRCRLPGQAVVTLGDRTAMAVGPCKRNDALARARLGGDPWPVVMFDYGKVCYCGSHRDAVSYGLLVVSEVNEVVRWLTNDLRLVPSPDHCMEAYAALTADRQRRQRRRLHDDQATAAEPLLVPALHGLPAAPHHRHDARLTVCGITYGTGPTDLLVAAVDALCYNAVDIAVCVAAKRSRLNTVLVDGPFSRYPAMLQRLSDIVGGRVIQAADDMAVHGATRMAAAVINAPYATESAGVAAATASATYRPTSTVEQRRSWVKQWSKAVRRSYGWARSATGDRRAVDDEFAWPERSWLWTSAAADKLGAVVTLGNWFWETASAFWNYL